MLLRLTSAFTLLAFVGCGSRSPLKEGQAELECETDSQCDQSDLCTPQVCVNNLCAWGEPVSCVAPDSCSLAACAPETGACEVTPRTLDNDGDGFRNPLPGFAPGEEGACGDDCDDTSALAFPGGRETCDGVDNDCDGVVDNGDDYLESLRSGIPEAVSLAGELDGSGRRGAAFGDGVFALSYWGRSGVTNGYLHGLNSRSEEVFEKREVSGVNAPSFGADVVWAGDAFGTVWSDPRVDENYEVYFSRFGSNGEKLGPDVRLTNADDFSIHARVLFDQGRFAVVFDDRREEEVAAGAQVFAQLVDSTGSLIGENVRLTERSENAEYPYFAATARRFGVVYTETSDTGVSLRFKTFDKEFRDSSTTTIVVDRDARAPRVVPVGDTFVVTWDVYSNGPGESIMGAILDEDAAVIVAPTALTSGAQFARSHDTVSLGDRILLFWADDADGNYELYAKTVAQDLTELEPRVRLTDDPADTLGPKAALGDGGVVGLLFDDWRDGTHGAYFSTLGCQR